MAKVTIFFAEIQPTLYMRIANPSREARLLGWASFLASADGVTLAGGTTFLHINILARLNGTTVSLASVM